MAIYMDNLTSYLTWDMLMHRAPSSSPTDLMTLHASMLTNFQQVVEVAKVSCTVVAAHFAVMVI
jgi:hypothetical protein